jgi:hypothetical protein
VPILRYGADIMQAATKLCAVQDPHGRNVATVGAEPDGTVVLVFEPGCQLNAENTVGVVRAHIAAAAGQKRPTLTDLRGMRSATREARELGAAADVVAVTLRMAILVGNPVTRVLGNFFVLVTGPKYPTKIFTEEAAARAWLRESP